MESNKSLYFKLVAVVLLIGLMFGLKAYQDAGKAKKTKEVTALKKAKEYVAEETKLYLKLKHNEEFGVSSVRYIPETEGYEIMVYPVKNPTVEFMVTKSRATGFQLNGSYKNKLRVLESINIMEPFAKKISDKYLIGAWFNGDILDEKEYWNMEIPLKEVIKKYPNPHCQVNCNDFFQNTSNGVSQPKHFLGIKLILIITSSTTLFVNDEKSVPLGKYLLNIPLVCSLVPLSHE